jgi:hypothetical protein
MYIRPDHVGIALHTAHALLGRPFPSPFIRFYVYDSYHTDYKDWAKVRTTRRRCTGKGSAF